MNKSLSWWGNIILSVTIDKVRVYNCILVNNLLKMPPG